MESYNKSAHLQSLTLPRSYTQRTFRRCKSKYRRNQTCHFQAKKKQALSSARSRKSGSRTETLHAHKCMYVCVAMHVPLYPHPCSCANACANACAAYGARSIAKVRLRCMGVCNYVCDSALVRLHVRVCANGGTSACAICVDGART